MCCGKCYFCNSMTIYCITVQGLLQKRAYTSLKGACDSNELSYSSASKGNRVFEKGGVQIVICEVELEKVKGRGGKR
jgi:hypothetical protein